MEVSASAAPSYAAVAGMAESQTSRVGNVREGGGLPLRSRWSLSHPEDEEHLTELVCLVRRQLEVFVAPPAKKRTQQTSKKREGAGAGADAIEKGKAVEGRGGAPQEDNSGKRPNVGAAGDDRGEKPVAVADGRVGIRCVHCAPPDGVDDTDVPCGAKRGRRRTRPGGEASPSTPNPNPPGDGGGGDPRDGKGGAAPARRRAKGAVTYPTSTRLVYQAIRNWQRYHFMACQDVPSEVKREYQILKTKTWQRRSGNDSAKYWEVGCARLGLIDTDDGLRVRKALTEGIWTEEMGRLAAEKVAEKIGLPLSFSMVRWKGEAGEAKPSNRFKGEGTTYETGANISGDSSTSDVFTALPQFSEKKTPKERKISGNANLNISFQRISGSLSSNGDRQQDANDDVMGTPVSETARVKPSGLTARKDNISSDADGCITYPNRPLSGLSSCHPLPFSGQRASASYKSESLMQTFPQSVPLLPSVTPFEPDTVILKRDDEKTPVAPPELFKESSFLNSTGTSDDTASIQASAELLGTAAGTRESKNGSSHMPASLEYCASSSDVLKSMTWSNEEILQRVRLARGVVHTIREIRQLPGPSEEVEQKERQDLTDLGLELYELFTGHRPFDANFEDNAGSGCRVAGDEFIELADGSRRALKQKFKREKHPEKRKYSPLRELGFPSSLCGMVSDLLDGGNGYYKSVDEVEEDLCLLETQPEKFLFPIPNCDFHIPENVLYGRTEEVSKLLEVYERVRADDASTGAINNMILISGYSGTGKSSLVRSVRSDLMERGARFVSGKFDSGQRMQALSAVVSALDDYCNILAQDKDNIDQVSQAITSAIGSEVAILAKIVPNLRKVISTLGEDSSLTQVSGREALQQLTFLFRMLLRSTCSRGNPIVMFIDDLQWADEVSLELIHALVTNSQTQGFLFIGCYRENEVCSGHPLLLRLVDIKKSVNVDTTFIRVGNMDGETVSTLLSDSLSILPRRTSDLSEAVMRKTGGNALFVVQFLASLCDGGLLCFSPSMRRWVWDTDRINDRDIADNVVELMRAKMLNLPSEVRDALRVVACFGANCQEDLLRIVDRSQDSTVKVVSALEPAVSDGLLVKTASLLRFSHDQVQRAAYSLVPDSEREELHLRLGRLICENASVDEIEKFLSVIVDQLHRGARLISMHDERINLAKLSLRAGKKASEFSAFMPCSVVYLKAGIELITDSDWESHRELCLDLYNLCAEMEYCLGHFKDAKGYAEEVIKRGNSLEDSLRAYYTLVQANGSEANTADAFAIATAVLAKLGELLPSSVTQVEVRQELLKTQALVQTKSADELLVLESMQNESKRHAMKFFKILLFYAYASRQEYFALVACRMVQLSLLYGVCRESPGALAGYGMIVCGMLGNAAAGYSLGRLALSVLERFDAKENIARVYCAMYGFIAHWIEPIQASVPSLKQGIDAGLSSGDTEYAFLNAHLYLGVSLASGKSLGPLIYEMRLYSKQMVEFNQNLVWLLNTPVRQAILNLSGTSDDPVKLVGDEMDENVFLQQSIEQSDYNALSSMVYFYRMWLEYLFGEYELAAETAKMNFNVEKHRMTRFVIVCNHAFYKGLSALALARKEGRTNWITIINQTMSQMKSWALSAPWNCQHKLDLMVAEFTYLNGDIDEAAEAYDRAATTAAKHGFIHEQALALERAGIFHLECRNNDRAAEYFEQSHQCYMQWEAFGKTSHVKSLYLQGIV